MAAGGCVHLLTLRGEVEIIITKHKGLSVMGGAGRDPDTCRRRSVMDHQRYEDREREAQSRALIVTY